MTKKLFGIFLLFVFSLSFVACNDTVSTTLSTTLSSLTTGEITITLEQNTLTLVEGDHHQISVSTNDEEGLLYSSSNMDVLVVDLSGLITAVSEGIASVFITSSTDESVSEELVVTVRKHITLVSQNEEIVMTEGDILQVSVVSNDDVSFASDDTEIFVVSETGLVTAKKEGTAHLIVSSLYDDSVEISVPVIVNKLITLTLNSDDKAMLIGDEYVVDYASNTEVLFTSDNPSVVEIDEFGTVSALSAGLATIKVESSEDSDVYEEFTILVFENTASIEIVGNPYMNLSSSAQLEISVLPDGAYDEVTWSSMNEDVVSVDEEGVITGVSVGTTSIIATSLFDSEIVDVIDIEVINVILVDSDAFLGSQIEYLGFDIPYGDGLFSTIQDGLDYATSGATLLVSAGTYTENLSIEENEVSLIGTDSTIIGSVTVSADDVSISGFEFTGASQIINFGEIINFTFVDNQVLNITTTSAFMHIVSVRGMTVTDNVFDTLASHAIVIEDFLSGRFLIQKNAFHATQDAIYFNAVNEYDILTQINIVRNTIESASNAIRIQLQYGASQKAIEAYARFNDITDITGYNVIMSLDNQVEFTLNFWGEGDMDYDKFVNVDPLMLRAYYTSADDIISEVDYNPAVPVIIEITNPIDEIIIGELHTFTFTLYPLDLVTNKIKWITSNPDVLRVTQYGDITPISSGVASITVRSSVDSSIATTVTVIVTTTPGIELTLTDVLSDVVVGDSFTIQANAFPISIANSAISFSSANEAVATIDSSGVVSTHSSGVAVLTAALVSDPDITTDFTVQVYDSLDSNNLLDLLTMNQVHYSTPHEYVVYGTSFNYVDKRYESVSRYYYGSIPVNTSKIVPVFFAIRPGEPFSTLPEGVDGFNATNLFWIVIHDTANTDTGGTALSHANYLYNSTLSGAELWVSWHFTVDDHDIYESLPEDERGFHAGDGSVLPYQGTTYLGGGNRNGIGIEMAINYGGDLYRTWQRTSKLTADLMVRYNLPRDHMKYHNDFSGKDCPKSLRNAGLIPLFELFEDIEYQVRSEHSDATIVFESHNLEYLDQTGRIIKMPDRAMTVSFTVTVTEDDVTSCRTFYTYLPGTVH